MIIKIWKKPNKKRKVKKTVEEGSKGLGQWGQKWKEESVKPVATLIQRHCKLIIRFPLLSDNNSNNKENNAGVKRSKEKDWVYSITSQYYTFISYS